MKVRDVMTPNPIVCYGDDTITDAAKAMRDEDCGAVPVIQEKNGSKVIGMVTDRDIVCRLLAAGGDPALAKVKEVMTRNVVSVHPDADLDECRVLMSHHRVRRLPVISKEGALCGVVSTADVARHLPQQPVGQLLRSVSLPH